MANFTYDDLSKHNFKYIREVLQDIKSGTKIKVDGKMVLLPDNIDIKEIEKLIKAGKEQPLDKYIRSQNTLLWTKVDKSKYSKIKSTGGSDKTSLQEVGFLLALDSLVNSKKTLDLATYLPSKKLKTKASYKDVVNFLAENDDWYKASIDGAEKVAGNFKQLTSYEFHHDTTEFNKIRKLGKKLSGLSNEDKWNPADVYLIKRLNLPTDNIIEYNEYIFSDGDVIGISLKKSEKEALHGAVALNVISEMFKGPKYSAKFTELDDKCQANITKNVKALKKSKIPVFIHADDARLSHTIPAIKPESKNYFKSVPVALEFLADNTDKIEEIAKAAILSAMSISPLSCAHWKLQGGDLSIMPSGQQLVEIIRLRIKLNGDTDTLIDFKFNKKQMKLQLRSKGSLPQFIIVKTAENPTGLLKIQEMK